MFFFFLARINYSEESFFRQNNVGKTRKNINSFVYLTILFFPISTFRSISLCKRRLIFFYKLVDEETLLWFTMLRKIKTVRGKEFIRRISRFLLSIICLRWIVEFQLFPAVDPRGWIFLKHLRRWWLNSKHIYLKLEQSIVEWLLGCYLL